METHVTFILDETGSMSLMQDEVIAGFNKYVEDMKNDGQDYSFSLLKFDTTKLEWVHRKVHPNQVITLNRTNYRPGAGTNLYDAVFAAIKTTEQDTIQNQKVMTVVFTDGQENSSQHTTADQMADLIKYKEGEGWAFLYLGVSPEAWLNERAFAGTGMANNSYRTSGAKAVHVVMDSASGVRTMYASGQTPDVQHLVSDGEKHRVSSQNQTTAGQTEDTK